MVKEPQRGRYLETRVFDVGSGVGLLLYKDPEGWRFGAWRVVSVRKGKQLVKAEPPPPSEFQVRRRFDSVEEAGSFFKQYFDRAQATKKNPRKLRP